MSQTEYKKLEAFTPELKAKFTKHTNYIANVWDSMQDVPMIAAECEREMRLSVPLLVEGLESVADSMALLLAAKVRQEEGEKEKGKG